MSDHDRSILHALLRNDLVAFTQRTFQTVVPGQTFLSNWHIEAIAYRLEQARHGEIRRLIITLPPRNLKSVCASVAFPAFVLGHDPSTRIVCASYSQDLTAKHARDTRAVISSAWYQRVFPRTRIDPKKNAETEFETTAKGYRLGTSVGGTLTGRGGSLIIIDDPLKPAEALSETKRAAVSEWYDSTLTSRLDDKKKDVIILIMQRLHVDDLVGHVLEKDGEHWDHLNLPAIADRAMEVPLGNGVYYHRPEGEILHAEREPLPVLEELRAAMGSQSFSAQYQQAPVPPEGALIQREWLGTYDRLPEPKQGDRIVQSWDTASKADKTNDYSVCTTWLMSRKDYYLLHVERRRLEFPDLKRRIIALAEAREAKTVLIEDAGSGISLIQELRHEGKVRPVAIKPDRDKISRLEGQSAVIEAGHVFLPAKAPWLDDFVSELLAFPFGRYDDQVDSLSQFLNWAAAQHRRVQRVGAAPILFTVNRQIGGMDFGFK
ncbi:MAG: terminase [Deltaproteobacteria bacterium]|jgi:predicted phage terminase large subunit-like protein|nr:terminase [Deltaproteobacteria bacterium]